MSQTGSLQDYAKNAIRKTTNPQKSFAKNAKRPSQTEDMDCAKTVTTKHTNTTESKKTMSETYTDYPSEDITTSPANAMYATKQKTS